MGELSKSQVDKLGERLRDGRPSEDDLRLLEEFKRSFAPAYEEVLQRLRAYVLSPLGRPEKSTVSIIAKLQRGTTKLSRMQDVAGCRVILDSIAEQDRVVRALQMEFPQAVIADRRAKPSHGYRAVHLVVRVRDRTIEVQVRTLLQHRWADLSQKLADTITPSIKYGGGPTEWQSELAELSGTVAECESLELAHADLLLLALDTGASAADISDHARRADELARRIIQIREAIAKAFDRLVELVPARKEQKG